MQGRTYRFFDGTPLYPFGFGLTYSEFELKSSDAADYETSVGQSIGFTLTVENKGPMDAREIIQVYVKTPDDGYKNPGPQLMLFKPVYVESGSFKEVHIELTPRHLSLINDEGKRIVKPGVYAIYAGTGQPDERTYELTGKRPVEFSITLSGETLSLEY